MVIPQQQQLSCWIDAIYLSVSQTGCELSPASYLRQFNEQVMGLEGEYDLMAAWHPVGVY